MELVRYHNDFNNVSLKGFREKELDLLFSICFKLRDEGTEEINLTFSELKELSKYNDRHLTKFIKDLDNIYKKLISLNFKYEDEKKITRFVLFKAYTIHKDDKMVSIKVNEEFNYILNELTGNYTKFELAQFTSLKSSYTKIIFRLLKQYFSTGWREFLYAEFRELLSIPDSYKPSDIDKQILNPSIKDLKQYFKNLKIIKIKNGRNLHKLRFEWDILEVLPPKEENNKKKKEIRKTPKEVQAELFNEKQEQDKKNQEINNKFIEKKYLDLMSQPIEIQELAYNRAYEKFLKESGSKDNRTMSLIFEKTKKILIVKEFELILEEKNEEELVIEEEKENVQEDNNIEETKQVLENSEKGISLGWEQKTEVELEAEKIIKKIFPFIEEDMIDEDINYVRSTLRRKKMYKELEIFDLFLEKKLNTTINPKDIYIDENCLGLSEFGKEYIENYIKEHDLEHLLISPKTKRELKGSARESRLVKLYKKNFKI